MRTLAQLLTHPDNENNNNVLMVVEDTDQEIHEIEWRPVQTYCIIEVTEETGEAKVGYKFGRDNRFHKPGEPDV